MINPSNLDLDESNIDDFRDLCSKIYTYISKRIGVSLFELNETFPKESNPLLDQCLFALLDDHCIRNGFMGYESVSPPLFEDTEEPSADFINDRLNTLRETDRRYAVILSQYPRYNPKDDVCDRILALRPSFSKTILSQCFIDLVDLETTINKKGAEKIVRDYCSEYPLDSIDQDLYVKYNLPENVILYAMNRSPAYARLMMMTSEPGFGDLMMLLTSRDQYDVDVPVDPGSSEIVGLGESILGAITYCIRGDNGPSSFVDAFLALFEGPSYLQEDIINIYNSYFNDVNANVSDEEWEEAFDLYLCTGPYVRHLSYSDVEAIVEIFDNKEEIGYGISIQKLFSSSGVDEYGLESEEELIQFIQRYTSLKIVGNRVLREGTLRDGVWNFIKDVKNYEKNRILSLYSRRCGGPRKDIDAIVDSIDMNDFNGDKILSEEEYGLLSRELENYEWITKINAKSLFSDKCGLADKYTDRNMHNLGFTAMSDVYFRLEYDTFMQCLLETIFTGDDVYVDERKFKINMESSAFCLQMDSLARSFHWIPLSKCYFINLRSEKHSRFAGILSDYRTLVKTMCKERFMTPYSLKNIKTGIEDIDDDDFDTSFYRAMLLSTGAKHQTIERQDFFYITSYSSEYRCIAPDFIRFIVYNNDGKASISELQAILSDSYGIDTNLSVIRNIVKASSCIFSQTADVVYLNEDYYSESLKNESE